VGNARTFLLAWLSARLQSGRVILRIEDIDSPRVKAWAVQQAIDDLRWLGLDWDEGPDIGGPHAPYIQTQRRDRYAAALANLQSQELAYPCTCTRSDVEAAASAPHAGQEGPVYPGTCRNRTVADAPTLTMPFAWRFRVEVGTLAFDDFHAGPQHCQIAQELGDFVVAKGDGSHAYQLAVVVDDHEMGITEVVRGDDLIPSTFRQVLLYEAFGWTPPCFAHVPLVVGPDGRRLAKRHGDTRISVLREAGVPGERLVGFLAWTCGLQSSEEPISARGLLKKCRSPAFRKMPGFDWRHIPREPLVFTPEMWNRLSVSITSD
jgi:glutamyl-tRNA synthetase